jgi:two-component system nitrate/nitrite response regulator NarL
VQDRETDNSRALVLKFCTKINFARASFCHSNDSHAPFMINSIVIMWMCFMGSAKSARPGTIGVLVADSNQMQCQLLVGALRRRPEFQVISCMADMDVILHAVAEFPVDVILMNADQPKLAGQDMANVRRLHLAYPDIAKVLVLGESNRDSVVNAFRSGVKGLFCFADYPFRSLCKCIQSVHQGQVWANSQQLQFLLEIVTQVPSLRMVNARGGTLLTPREEQVVALVADGRSNREVARELGLSEHTVKKYMFHIFDKLGISSRVELTLYAMSHGGTRQAEWVAGGQ